MLAINKEEIEKKLINIKLAKDIDELKEAIMLLTRTIVEEISKADYEELTWI